MELPLPINLITMSSSLQFNLLLSNQNQLNLIPSFPSELLEAIKAKMLMLRTLIMLKMMITRA
jgi:hypothetical protein